MSNFDFLPNYDSEATIPEQYRTLYNTGEDGAFTRREGVDSLVETVLSQRKALDNARRVEKEAIKKQVDLSPLSDFGASVDEIKAAFQVKLEELERQVAGGEEAKVNLDKALADRDAHWQKKLEAEKGMKENLQNQLYQRVVRDDARRAIGDQAVDADLLMPFIEDLVTTIEDNGIYKAIVKDIENGGRRVSPATGMDMTLDELVVEMKGKEKFAPLFKSEAKPGSGTLPGSTTIRPKITGKDERTALQKLTDGLAARAK